MMAHHACTISPALCNNKLNKSEFVLQSDTLDDSAQFETASSVLVHNKQLYRTDALP